LTATPSQTRLGTSRPTRA